MGPSAKAAIPALAETLRDSDIYVATDASLTLAGMGADAALGVLTVIQDPNPRVRELAVRTLRSLGVDAKSAVPALTERLRDTDVGVRQAAIFALREVGPDAKAAISVLAETLRDPDRYLAVDAAHTLGGMGPDAIPSIVPMMRDCNPRVRELAVWTVRQIGNAATISGVGH
jgi:HEAT repeat protein